MIVHTDEEPTRLQPHERDFDIDVLSNRLMAGASPGTAIDGQHTGHGDSQRAASDTQCMAHSQSLVMAIHQTDQSKSIEPCLCTVTAVAHTGDCDRGMH